MLYNNLVIIHVLGATTLFATLIFEIYILWRKQEYLYSQLARILGFIIGFEIISGGFLTFVASAAPSLSKVCAGIGLYFLILMVAELALYSRMNKIPNLFPLRQVLTLPSIGLVFTALVLVIKLT